MANIGGLLSSALNREPQIEEVGIGGFTLMARVRESFSLNSQAPTTYLEDGTYAHDQIINEPLQLSIEGEVSDIFARKNPKIELQRRVSSQIGVITKYLPLRTQSQISKINAIINDTANAARAINTAIDEGRNAYDFFGNKDTASKGLREQFIDFVESIHYGKQLINIDMPFRTHEQMHLSSIVIDRDNVGSAIKFSITATKIRFNETEVKALTDFFPAASKGIGGQEQIEKDKGVQTGNKNESMLFYLKEMFKGGSK